MSAPGRAGGAWRTRLSRRRGGGSSGVRQGLQEPPACSEGRTRPELPWRGSTENSHTAHLKAHCRQSDHVWARSELQVVRTHGPPEAALLPRSPQSPKESSRRGS